MNETPTLFPNFRLLPVYDTTQYEFKSVVLQIMHQYYKSRND